jgi:hypothetical protein
MPTLTKTCKECGEAKPLDDFHRHPLGQHQRQNRCKPCHNRKSAEAYHARSPTSKAEYIARVKARKYGMTLEEMQTLVEAHGDLCDICGQPDTTHRKRTWTRNLTMDHCHSTGRFRGMLCSNCNIAIGLLKDDPALARKVAEYLEKC